jgi:thiol-disulfide isomerase/thioredoxin
MKIFFKKNRRVLGTLFCVFLLNGIVGRSAAAENSIPVLFQNGSLKLISSEVKTAKSFSMYFYFASWCEYCKSEVGQLKKFQAEQPERLNIIGISGDESEEEARKVSKSWTLSFPIYWDFQEQFKNTLHISKIPFVVLVSSEGKPLLTHASTSHFKDFLNSAKNILLEDKAKALR